MEGPIRNLSYRVFQGDWGWGTPFPDLTKRTPVHEGRLAAGYLDLGLSMFRERFAISFEGDLVVPTTGKYRFEGTVDDQAHLWIDGNAIRNDAAIAHRYESVVSLAQGSHSLRLDYIDLGGEARMSLRMVDPAGESTSLADPPQASGWRQGIGGHPHTNRTKASLFRTVELPDDFEIDLEIASSNAPQFVLAIGRDRQNAESNHSLRVETWGDELVVVQDTVFEPVMTIGKDMREVRLQLVFDSGARALQVFDASGVLLITVKGVQATTGNSGIYIRNRGWDLCVRRLSIYRRSSPGVRQAFDATRPRVHLIDGQVVYGRLTVAEGDVSIVDDDGRWRDIDLNVIDRIAGPGVTLAVTTDVAELSYADGTIVRGCVEQVNPDQVMMRTMFSDAQVTCALAGASLLGGLGLLGDVDDVRFFLMHCGPALGLLVVASWAPWIIQQAKRHRPLLDKRWLAVAVILAVVGGLYVGLASPCSLFDRDEPRYAKATAEMLASGNLLEPTFNGDYRLHKPPAIYWLMSASVKVLGRSELAFRSPSILATLATLLVLRRIGRRLSIGGVWPMLVLAGSSMMLLAGTWAITDAALLCTVATAMMLFVEDCLRGPAWPRTLLAGLVWGAALLVKGPVGVAIILTSILLSWLLGRGQTKLGGKYAVHLLVMLVISIGALLAWAIPVNIATEGKLLEVVNREFVQRLFEKTTRHGGNYFAAMPVYLPALIVGFFPWVGLLPASTSAALGGRIGGRIGRALLIGWSVPTFVMMTLIATRLPHYILPMFPALALAAAGVLAAKKTLTTRDEKLLVHGGRIFVGMAWFGAGVLLAVPTVLTVLVYRGLPELPGVMRAALAAGLVMAALPLALRRLHPVVHVHIRAGLTVFGAAVLTATLAFVSLPQAEEHQLIKPLALELNERFPNTPIAVCDFDEPSLMFYLDRPTVIDDDINRWTIFEWARREGPGLLITTQEEIDKAKEQGLRLGPIRKIRDLTREGCNYSTGHWVRVVVFERIERQHRTSGEASP